MSPLPADAKEVLRAVVGAVPALWQAAETTVDDRTRLLRCLSGAGGRTRAARARGAGGRMTLGIGWRSGTCTEVRVRRPASSAHARTPAMVRDRARARAPQRCDARIAERLTADGLTTRRGRGWRAARVQHMRANPHVRTGCPALPRAGQPRGDGLVPARTAAKRVGVEPTALGHWRRWGLLLTEQREAGAPLWVRRTPADSARLDGTVAAQGYGQGRLRDACDVVGLTQEQPREHARGGEVIAYRGRVAQHWAWRGGRAADREHPAAPPAVAE